VLITRAQLALIVGVSEGRISQFAAEGMPRAGKAAFPLVQCIQWYLEYRRKHATQMPLGDARRRKIEADASTAEIGLAQKRGELIEVGLAARVHGARCARLRTRLIATPTKVAPAAHRAKTVREVETLLQREVVEALEELAGGVRNSKAA
jgi:phage terminase Nu1 subunit (DNA packaging protein)